MFLVAHKFKETVDKSEAHHWHLLFILKGQCHEIFNYYFCCLKDSTGPHMNRQKRFRELFRFREDS